MALSDIFAAFRWWAVVSVIGIVATPFTYYVLGRIPDRGYAFTKLIGLLIVGYLFWFLGSVGFIDNSLGGIFLAVGIMIALSIWSFYRQRSESEENQSVLSWLREHWRYVLVAELVFAIIFALWTWVRSQNPSITGTEKPMEFAFLNSMGRSQEFPPLDPWLSGFAISYYYFGYVITSVITRLAVVQEAVGYNLALAWLAAASALGAFGLVYNLISSSRAAIKRTAMIFAIVAAVALPIAGNLEIAAEVLYAEGVGSPELWEWLDIRDLNESPGEASTPRYESSQWWWWRSSRVIHEYSLSGREEAGLEPIAEFPGFSFILGDLHSHVLSLPFAFLSIAVALSWWLHPGFGNLDLKKLAKPGRYRATVKKLNSRDGILLLFTAIILGGLSFLNTWDVLIHLFIIVGAFLLGRWRQTGHWQRTLLWQSLTFAVVLTIGSLILYLPFYLGFRSQAGPPFILPMTMRPTRLVHVLVIFGMSFIGVIALSLALFIRAMRTPSATKVRHYWTWSIGISMGIIIALVLMMLFFGLLIATSDESLSTIYSLADDLDRSLPELPLDPSSFLRFRWAVAAITTLLPTILVARAPHSALIIALSIEILIAVYLIMRLLDRDFDPQSRDQLADQETTVEMTASVVPSSELIASEMAASELTASEMTASEMRASELRASELTEPATVSEEQAIDQPLVDENISANPATSEQRSVLDRVSLPNMLPFIFLLVLTGILLVLGPEFVYLKDNFGQRLNTIFKFYYQAWVLFGVVALFSLDYLLRNFRLAGILATSAYGVALVASLLFPYYAVQSRAAEYRGSTASESRAPATLDGLAYIERYNPDELEAIAWLDQNADGMAVVVEAVGGQYTNYGRVSANTGIPTLLGWAGHEYQWRGSTAEPAVRGSAVEIIYDGLDWERITALLDEYDVSYIFLGSLERSTLTPRAEESFDQRLDLAFENESVKIYRWTPSNEVE